MYEKYNFYGVVCYNFNFDRRNRWGRRNNGVVELCDSPTMRYSQDWLLARVRSVCASLYWLLLPQDNLEIGQTLSLPGRPL